MTPHEKLVTAVAACVVVACLVGWLFHWYVFDCRLWWRTLRTACRNGMVAFDVARRPFRGVLHGLRRDLGPDWAEDWQREPVTDYDADLLIAGWRDDSPGPATNGKLAGNPDPTVWAGGLQPWHERMWWDDPDLTVWDARQAALRCWEILHIEFPRLRAELGIPA